MKAERIGPGLKIADEIRKLHLASIESFRPYRDEFFEVMRIVARHADDGETYDRIHRLFEDLAAVVCDQSFNYYNDEFGRANLVFIVRELFLHSIAVLLDAQRFDGMQRMLSRYYVASALNASGVVRSVETLDQPSGCIENSAAQLLRDRATLPRIDVAALRDAEFICAVRARLDASYDEVHSWGARFWWPKLQSHFGFVDGDLRIVARLKDPYFRERIARVFDADSGDTLRLRIAALPDLPSSYSQLSWTNATVLLSLFGFPAAAGKD